MEGERFLDEVLYAQIVAAVLHGVGAEHLKLTFVVVGGLDGPGAVDGDEVAAFFVGDHAQGAARIHLDLHVEMDVGAAGVVRRRGRRGLRIGGCGVERGVAEGEQARVVVVGAVEHVGEYAAGLGAHF